MYMYTYNGYELLKCTLWKILDRYWDNLRKEEETLKQNKHGDWGFFLSNQTDSQYKHTTNNVTVLSDSNLYSLYIYIKII